MIVNMTLNTVYGYFFWYQFVEQLYAEVDDRILRVTH